MPLFIPALIGGLAAIGGGIIGAVGANKRNKDQIALAREQMAFQERMSSTSWQRAVKDMKLSGINPALAYQQGGASSPGGAMPTLENSAAAAVSSATAALRLRNEIKQADMDIKLKKALEYKTRQEGFQARATAAAMNWTPSNMGSPENQSVYMRSLVNQWAREGLKNNEIQARIRALNAMLPGMGIKGSKAAAVMQMIFGGAGVGRLIKPF